MKLTVQDLINILTDCDPDKTVEFLTPDGKIAEYTDHDEDSRDVTITLE